MQNQSQSQNQSKVATDPTQQMIDGIKQSTPQMKEMMKNFQNSGGDPKQLITKIFGDNPAVNMAMGNPEQAVRSMLQQQGINVEQFMAALNESLF